MHVIEAKNVSDALAKGITHLLENGERENSRNGAVLVAPTPVVTVYTNPKRRVLQSATRDANPFFHLMESLWMLAGRNDLKFPQQFNQRFGEYSDDGVVVHGAYGYRWRRHFGYDQLEWLIDELKSNPTSRRAVLAMWDGGSTIPGEAYTMDGSLTPDIEAVEGSSDLYVATHGGKDVPCNTHAYFDVRGGLLNMTVCCRSNDIIWGAYGANAVHFSILQEYMAARVGVDTGVYRQVSNNFHAYTEVYNEDRLKIIAQEATSQAEWYPYSAPLVDAPMFFEADLAAFMHDPTDMMVTYYNLFFMEVARPMFIAHKKHKEGDREGALISVDHIGAPDWRQACHEWLQRRYTK